MEFLLILYFAVGLFFFFYFAKKRLFSPTTIFLFSQLLFLFGMIQFLSFDGRTDLKIVGIYIVAMAFFGLGSLGGARLFHYQKSRVTFTEQTFTPFQAKAVKLLILFSLFLLVYFCFMTRFSTVKSMLGGLFGADMGDITDNRLQSYSVPGTAIIYMFRVVLFPTVVISVLNREYGYSRITRCLLLLVMVFFTLITGQRAGFVMVVLMWMLSYMIRIFYEKDPLTGKRSKEAKRLMVYLVLVFGAFFAIFSFLSLLNGRVSDSIVSEFVNRFLTDNQRTAYASFEYIFETGTCWGRNWYEEIVNLTYPGEKYLPLSKIVNQIIYGSTRGTAPPCLWGSVFYNFSWIGVAAFAALYGLLLQYMEYRFYSKEISAIRCTVYSYIFIALGMLVAGGPLHLVNNGFAPLVVLTIVLRVDKHAKKCTRRLTDR